MPSLSFVVVVRRSSSYGHVYLTVSPAARMWLMAGAPCVDCFGHGDVMDVALRCTNGYRMYQASDPLDVSAQGHRRIAGLERVKKMGIPRRRKKAALLAQ